MDQDQDPAIFVIDLQDANYVFPSFFGLLLFLGTFTSFFHFSKTKSPKEVTKQ